jgi:signal transduction histidine kinase
MIRPALSSPAPSLARRAWRWPALRLRPALGLLAGFLLLGVWLGTTALLTMRGDGSQLPWSRPMLWELTGALSAYLALPISLTAAANAPRGRWVRFAAVHLAGFVVFSAVKLTLMIGSRDVLYPALGWGEYQYGPFALRIPMELQKDLVGYGLFLAALELWRLWRERQAVELHLREARLRALTGQLGPHFLFNALNTVSAVMYEDLGRTDRLLADLGALLRASYQADAPSWTLAEERAYAERYLRVVAARFGERIAVRWELAEAAGRVQVPRFALQQLVENAIKHNADREENLAVQVTARLAPGPGGERLQLAVVDDGVGFAAAAPAGGGGEGEGEGGTGLRHLRRSLELLFGDRAHLTLGAGAGGRGARVALELPVQP